MAVSITTDPFKITIDTDRLHIESYDDAHFDNSFIIYSHPTNTKYFDEGGPRSLEQITELVNDIGHTYFDQGLPFGLFSVFTKDGTEFIGHVDFMPGPSESERKASPHEVEIGYILDPAYHKQGYATEAVTAIIRRFIPFLNAEKGFEIQEVMATYHHKNASSRALLERVGLRFQKSEKRYGELRHWHSLRIPT